MEVFNKQATVLVEKLAKELDNEAGFDCVRYITLCSLDIICGRDGVCITKARY